MKTRINRRTVLQAIGITPLIAVPAVAMGASTGPALAENPSKIMPVFRQWNAFQGADHNHLTGKQSDAEVDKMFALEHRLADMPATTLTELAAKLIAITEYGDWDLDGITGKKLLAEACCLAGVPVKPQVVSTEPTDAPPALPIDPIPGWYKDWLAIKDEWMKYADDSPEDKEVWGERERLGHLICDAKATTIEGALAQLQWFQDDLGYLVTDAVGQGFEVALPNLVISLQGLAGEAT